MFGCKEKSVKHRSDETAPIFSLERRRSDKYVAPVSTAISEADILDEVIAPDRAGFNPAAAKSILKLRFSDAAQKRIRKLLDANNRGTLRAAGQADLEKYLRVGQLIDLLQAKARISLAQRSDEQRT